MGYEAEQPSEVVTIQQQQLLSGLLELHRNQQLVDVTICAENEKFPCHKTVLAASSPYFRYMYYYME